MVPAASGKTAVETRLVGDFFVCDFFAAVPKHDLASMEHPIFSLSTRPDRRVVSYDHNGATLTVTPSVKGRATIFDADILIFCISQLMAALNQGRAVSRKLSLTAHDLLQATNRETSGDGYKRLRDAFERLAGTRITGLGRNADWRDGGLNFAGLAAFLGGQFGVAGPVFFFAEVAIFQSAPSVPGVIGRCSVAIAAVGVTLGSTTISRPPRR